MLLLTYLSILAITSALPTQQIVGPAATLAAIPATNHILILTPQAQVQLEPMLKYPQPLVQHLAPIARIDSPTDQTVVYYPNENLMNVFPQTGQKPKQLESTNITNIVNQFVSAGQTAQAQLEAFQQQLSQGLETLIQPVGGQKTESDSDAEMDSLKPVVAADQITETSRQDGGRFYSIPKIPQFFSNFEVIQTPLNPLYTVQPYQAIRARSVAYPEEKILINAAPKSAEDENFGKIHTRNENHEVESKLKENAARSVEIEEVRLGQLHYETTELGGKIAEDKKSVPESSYTGKHLGSLEEAGTSHELQPELKKQDRNIALKKQGLGIEQSTFAEPLLAGLVGKEREVALSQAKPVGSEMAGKDEVAFPVAPGTVIPGSTDEKIGSKSS